MNAARWWKRQAARRPGAVDRRMLSALTTVSQVRPAVLNPPKEVPIITPRPPARKSGGTLTGVASAIWLRQELPVQGKSSLSFLPIARPPARIRPGCQEVRDPERRCSPDDLVSAMRARRRPARKPVAGPSAAGSPRRLTPPWPCFIMQVPQLPHLGIRGSSR